MLISELRAKGDFNVDTLNLGGNLMDVDEDGYSEDTETTPATQNLVFLLHIILLFLLAPVPATGCILYSDFRVSGIYRLTVNLLIGLKHSQGYDFDQGVHDSSASETVTAQESGRYIVGNPISWRRLWRTLIAIEQVKEHILVKNGRKIKAFSFLASVFSLFASMFL
ncbi:hypothetical protein BKA70DRAFT_1436936 [Coprinopsis sp. MPI-PUGE-AT-0042]|nr:hypothetical protein BKA70DRAFT_1436936 [Coprinopsis sp. MPI-PUGE-AT-0042]